LPPYRYNVSAKAAYGHAALIVGYNNTDYTFTILNSWGSGLTPSNSRTSGGITADGMFKVQMGLLGKLFNKGTKNNYFVHQILMQPT
jgi:hypothetical protein